MHDKCHVVVLGIIPPSHSCILCLQWMSGVVSRIHSSVKCWCKFVGLPLLTCATVEWVCYTTVYRGISSLTLTYSTLDRCKTYTYTTETDSW